MGSKEKEERQIKEKREVGDETKNGGLGIEGGRIGSEEKGKGSGRDGNSSRE